MTDYSPIWVLIFLMVGDWIVWVLESKPVRILRKRFHDA